MSKMVGGSSAHTPTPTWTEGTPSFTESSSSGELGRLLFFTNRVKKINVIIL